MKFFCIGKNYLEHIRELNHNTHIPARPVIFIKPATAFIHAPDKWVYPDFTQDLQYEIELALRVGKGGKNIAERDSLQHIDALSVGLDLTARDLQTNLTNNGLPWEVCKAFDDSALLGTWREKSHFQDLSKLCFHLDKNGKTVQKACAKDMIHSMAHCIHEISIYFTLEVGDIILTGTPPGVGRIDKGDLLEGFLENERAFSWQVK